MVWGCGGVEALCDSGGGGSCVGDDEEDDVTADDAEEDQIQYVREPLVDPQCKKEVASADGFKNLDACFADCLPIDSFRCPFHHSSSFTAILSFALLALVFAAISLSCGRIGFLFTALSGAVELP